MFIIPFVFAIYPELLLIDAAVLDPTSLPSAAKYLPGYDGQLHLGALAWLLLRLIGALYLIASALAGFDRKSLSRGEIFLRLALAILVLFKPIEFNIPAAAAIVALLVFHFIKNKEVIPVSTPPAKEQLT